MIRAGRERQMATGLLLHVLTIYALSFAFIAATLGDMWSGYVGFYIGMASGILTIIRAGRER